MPPKIESTARLVDFTHFQGMLRLDAVYTGMRFYGGHPRPSHFMDFRLDGSVYAARERLENAPGFNRHEILLLGDLPMKHHFSAHAVAPVFRSDDKYALLSLIDVVTGKPVILIGTGGLHISPYFICTFNPAALEMNHAKKA